MSRISDHYVKLVCSVCKKINYRVRKNKKAHPEKLALKKFCPHDRKHTVHNEVK